MVVSEEVLNKLFQDSPHPSTHRKRYPTTPPPKKKLIEVTLPLAAINKASVREKSIRHGHPSTLPCGGRGVHWQRAGQCCLRNWWTRSPQPPGQIRVMAAAGGGQPQPGVLAPHLQPVAWEQSSRRRQSQSRRISWEQ
ncbi:MAG: hypothetical protein TQ37_04450 [Candidatus Synechococcus spongiarum 15L]|uniref:DUF1156 domain-containing protein n=1 Tax=Candidatus Synechococcus spongiarum 15L TaxID=1608419 RepID=A0A0G8AWG0_9SYNE|nr:MAG: hypothetical protein TQ37_04450 [Candidatus Synechococcus spongiarum 15L]